MNRLKKALLRGVALLTGTMLLFGAVSAYAAGAPAAKIPTQTGVVVYANAKASIDASNLGEGYILVKYTGASAKVKTQIAKAGGSTYTYDLTPNLMAALPLTEGNGTYAVRVFENAPGTTKYAIANSADLNLVLRNEYMPFLYPNQFVNFTGTTASVTKAAELTAGMTDDIQKVQAVFNYVTNNFTYDYQLAQTVTSGYIPNINNVMAVRKGICFDYSAVMASMLRSQNIPCKLVVGYAGTTYHAWIDVYTRSTGWVDKVIYFDGIKFTLMDPTYVSTGQHSDSIMKYVTTNANYVQKYVY